MDGLLDLQGILAQFAPTDDERKKSRMEGILAAGLSLLGAQKGQELPALGRAGLLGMGTMNESLGDTQKARALNINTAAQASTLQEALRKRADEDAARKVAIDFYKQQGVPSVPGGGMPTVGDGADLPQSGMATTTGKQSKFDQYSALAQKYASNGLVDAAQKAADLAEKFRPKIKDTKTLTQNGQRVTVNIYDDGTMQVMPYGPDKEKLHFADAGGQAGVGFEPFTGAQQTPGIAKTMTLAEVESAKNARAHLGIAGAQLQLARENANKPVLQTDTTTGQVYAVDPRNATGKIVTGPDGQPLSKGEKPLTEAQAKATAYANQMSRATEIINDLGSKGFKADNLKQQADVSRAGSQGIPYVPGSAALMKMSSSDEAQKYRQAELTYTEAGLRFMTGANAPEQEVIRAADTYFPRPGEGPEVIAQKAQARRNLEESIRMAAGQGAAKLPALGGGDVPTLAPNQVRTPDGKVREFASPAMANAFKKQYGLP